jgi:hypothetical protein
MAPTPPTPTPRKAGGVFLRIRPGVREAIIVRPMNAKAGEKYTKVTKFSQERILEMVRIWRKETHSTPSEVQKNASIREEMSSSRPDNAA